MPSLGIMNKVRTMFGRPPKPKWLPGPTSVGQGKRAAKAIGKGMRTMGPGAQRGANSFLSSAERGVRKFGGLSAGKQLGIAGGAVGAIGLGAAAVHALRKKRRQRMG